MTCVMAGVAALRGGRQAKGDIGAENEAKNVRPIVGAFVLLCGVQARQGPRRGHGRDYAARTRSAAA